MSESTEKSSIKTAVFAGLLTVVAFGGLGASLNTAGWLSTTLSPPALIGVAIALGVVAGVIAARRKRPIDDFQLRRD